ncbi:glycosyltransferase [Lithospermum erythrorhizon]|uniref:Glycosyltransferase n=1 Tax=Lithospermum erythrorhizon TaxID=34254 RepID=A0AAV3Q4W3_LITER
MSRDFNSLMKAIKTQGFSSLSSSSSFRLLSKLILFIIIIGFITYTFHSFSSDNVANFIRPSSSNSTNNVSSIIRPSSSKLPKNSSANFDCKKTKKETTQLHHLVFAIASSSKVWQRRQNYVKLWWKPDKMRGFVWLDERIKNQTFDHQLLPTIKISSNTSEFKDQYNNDESAVRIARVVSETFRLGSHDNVRWFIMADDDTFVVTDNLIRVLRKYDHNQFYYIGGSSETHVQNIIFGYNTAFGGGGFAISYPLAKALAEIQDTCMKRYNNLYTSDHRIQACMAEIGVPLTREVGFHQVCYI